MRSNGSGGGGEQIAAGTEALRPTWPPRGRYFVLPEHRMMFVSVAKNACTSIKWLLAELTGQDPARFHTAISMSSTPADTIHLRGLWQGVPTYDPTDPEQVARIRPENGWFVFGVVRDPWSRMFSAWQSKFLNHDPWFQRFSDEPFYPDLPTSTADVVDSFARFVRFLDEHPEHMLASRDNHFRGQVDMLMPARIPYSRIYDVSEMGTLLADMGAHLVSVGKDVGELRLRRDNTTPLHAFQGLYADGIKELIDHRYADDLAEFGDRWSFSDLPEAEPDWPPALFRSMAATAAANDRIRFLARDRDRLAKSLDDTRERAEASSQRVRALERGEQLTRPARIVERVLRRARRTAGRILRRRAA